MFSSLRLSYTILVTTNHASWNVLKTPSSVASEMVDFFAITFMDTTLTFCSTSCTISIRSTFLLERRAMILVIFPPIVSYPLSHFKLFCLLEFNLYWYLILLGITELNVQDIFVVLDNTDSS